MAAADEPDPVALAARALGRRDRSTREIDELLARAGVGEAKRGDALETLRRLGYLDDARFAAARAGALAARGYGDAAIEADLARHGVEGDLARDALATLRPEAERAARLFARDGPTARVARRLAAKGFGREAVEDALRSVVAGGDAEAV